MSRRIRVLMSARDPGGAAQVREVAPALRADSRLEVVVAASGPAADILTTAGEQPRRFTLPDGRTHVAFDDDPSALLEEAERLIAAVAPDVIVTAISSLGVGIDEALLARAGGRPTFALQDYPGDANAIRGEYAATYFVRDDAAGALTTQRFGVRTVPIGSIRHAAYAHIDVHRLRDDARRAAGADGTRPVVGFFGQPSEIPGHETAFADLVAALARREPRPLVILREHPKAVDRRGAHRAALADARLTVHDASDAPGVEPWLAACDVVTTCFSHCTMDYAFLTARSDEPLGAVLFVMTAPESWRFIREYGGLDAPDGVHQGLGRVARASAEVEPLLDTLLTDTGRRDYHAACRRLPRGVAFDAIVDAVVKAATP